MLPTLAADIRVRSRSRDQEPKQPERRKQARSIRPRELLGIEHTSSCVQAVNARARANNESFCGSEQAEASRMSARPCADNASLTRTTGERKGTQREHGGRKKRGNTGARAYGHAGECKWDIKAGARTELSSCS